MNSTHQSAWNMVGTQQTVADDLRNLMLIFRNLVPSSVTRHFWVKKKCKQGIRRFQKAGLYKLLRSPKEVVS